MSLERQGLVSRCVLVDHKRLFRSCAIASAQPECVVARVPQGQRELCGTAAAHTDIAADPAMCDRLPPGVNHGQPGTHNTFTCGRADGDDACLDLFAHIVDGDGMRVELWEANDEEYEKIVEDVTG